MLRHHLRLVQEHKLVQESPKLQQRALVQVPLVLVDLRQSRTRGGERYGARIVRVCTYYGCERDCGTPRYSTFHWPPPPPPPLRSNHWETSTFDRSGLSPWLGLQNTKKVSFPKKQDQVTRSSDVCMYVLGDHEVEDQRPLSGDKRVIDCLGVTT